MAMQQCKECGNEVSSKAAACPQCGAPVKKKTSPVAWGCLTLILLFVGLAIIGSLTSNNTSSRSSSSTDTRPVDYSVTYLVGGTASEAALTYQNEQGGTQQEKVRVPWQKSFRMQRGGFLYISAQNQGSYGDITVQITVNGSEFKRSTASGGYTIASASGSCCK